jgi:hypothetical protein
MVHGGSGSISGLVMWDLTLSKVTLRRVFSEYFGFPCHFSFHRLLHIRLSSYHRGCVVSVLKASLNNQPKYKLMDIGNRACSDFTHSFDLFQGLPQTQRSFGVACRQCLAFSRQPFCPNGRFPVPMATIRRVTVSWNVTPCIWDISLRACVCWLLAWLTCRLWIWRWYFPPKRRALSEIHGFTTHKIILILVTAVKNSDPLYSHLYPNRVNPR